MSTLSSLRNEQGRQKLSDREITEQAKQVKPVGLVQDAEPIPTRDDGKSDVRTWEAVFERENKQTALNYYELLPATGTVQVKIPAKEKCSTLFFTCSMGMYTRQIVFE